MVIQHDLQQQQHKATTTFCHQGLNFGNYLLRRKRKKKNWCLLRGSLHGDQARHLYGNHC
uniref:Uncharacterized protein n=1 Tax=Mytilus trossulus TaxID=6551 RepID=A0A077GYV1_MYTTR